jgi:protein-disulfide isomerase
MDMSTLQTAGDDDRDWVRGPEDATVTLLVYGDYECTFCAKAFRELRKVEIDVGERLRTVFRHFPLSQLHPHALGAAEAAEAAGAQSQFWEMHEKLFLNQHNLETSALLAYAGDLGLDLPRFARDIQEHRYLPKVRRDVVAGTRSGVSGTPTFFLDGQRWSGPYSADELAAGIEGRLRPPPVDPVMGELPSHR